MKFEGIYTPAITPLHDDQSIDWDGFAAVLESLISAGVHGIIIGGTTGEYYAHSAEERMQTLVKAKEIVGTRLPLIGGTGALRTEESIGYAEAAKAAGYDAILVATPPYSQPTPRENALHALRVDRAVDLPIMLYNYPGRMAAEMSEEYLDRVGRSPNFCAIKESSGDINRVHLLARDYPHIQLSCGMDDQALEFFVWAIHPVTRPSTQGHSTTRSPHRLNRPLKSSLTYPIRAFVVARIRKRDTRSYQKNIFFSCDCLYKKSVVPRSCMTS